MASVAFDTHEFIKALKAGGFDEQQAETLTVEMRKIHEQSFEGLATRNDIELLRKDLTEMELRLKYDLTLRLGGMLAAGVAIVATLVKLL